MTSLKEKQKKAASHLLSQGIYRNSMSVPKLLKVTVNTGFGKSVAGKSGDEQKKFSAAIVDDLTVICSQKAVVTKAKKSISTFKTRKGMPLGAKVTLRGQKMYDFLDILINVALPRSRDFRGIDPASIDKQGNLVIGIKEHTVFPQVSLEKSKVNFGLEAIIHTNTKNQEKGREFFSLLDFPLKKQ